MLRTRSVDDRTESDIDPRTSVHTIVRDPQYSTRSYGSEWID